MDNKLEQWSKTYNLNDLKLVGYSGGYPMIQFYNDKEINIPENKIKKIVRQAEMAGGFQLGVGINFRKTADVIVNNETIVIYGHEFVIERILEKLF